MKATASIRLKFPSEKLCSIVCKALMPEVNKPPATRSRASLKKEKRSLILVVEARDTVALRAALNAYLRWVATICEVISTLRLADMPNLC